MDEWHVSNLLLSMMINLTSPSGAVNVLKNGREPRGKDRTDGPRISIKLEARDDTSRVRMRAVCRIIRN